MTRRREEIIRIQVHFLSCTKVCVIYLERLLLLYHKYTFHLNIARIYFWREPKHWTPHEYSRILTFRSDVETYYDCTRMN
jgi:hypothetical protein